MSEARRKVDSAFGRYRPNATIVVDADDDISAADLVRVELPEPRWAVAGVLPEGVVLLVGKSKLGKSWLALDAAIAIAEGGIVWGAIEVEQGDGVAHLIDGVGFALIAAEGSEVVHDPMGVEKSAAAGAIVADHPTT